MVNLLLNLINIAKCAKANLNFMVQKLWGCLLFSIFSVDSFCSGNCKQFADHSPLSHTPTTERIYNLVGKKENLFYV